MKELLGCRKTVGKYRSCGDISFANKIILCEECKKSTEERITRAIKKKWEAERNHCGDCESGNYCATCKPEFDKLNEIINIRDVLEK